MKVNYSENVTFGVLTAMTVLVTVRDWTPCFVRHHFLNIQGTRFTLQYVTNLSSFQKKLLPPFSGLKFIFTFT